MLGHPGQSEAWKFTSRVQCLQAGWQSGKTDYLVQWVYRQAARSGPGDALVLAPTHPLLEVAPQPRIVKLFESLELGEEKVGAQKLVVSESGLRRMGWKGKPGSLTIWFRHTQDVKKVEAATALWVAADECGQMSDEVWEAINGRTSGTGGDILLISRPYFDNWFRKLCESSEPWLQVRSFASWDNPGWQPNLNPKERGSEIERLKNSMPLWRFQMKYGGVFTRPAGAIIDNWKDEYETPPFLVPHTWKRYTFHDFGPVHAFVISVAEHPTEKDSEGYPVLVCYREHFPNKAYATWQLVRDVKKSDERDFADYKLISGLEPPEWRPRGIGGNHGENDWRKDYANSGLAIEQTRIIDVGSQIDRLYACVGRGGLRITKDCRVLLQMLRAWSWEVDDAGEPIPGKIMDDAKFHGPAALRYGVSQLRPNTKEEKAPEPEPPMFTLESHGYGRQPKQAPKGW